MKSRNRGKDLRKLLKTGNIGAILLLILLIFITFFSWKKERKCFRGLRRALQRTAIEINWKWNERQSLAEDFAEELCQSGNCGG